MTRPIKVLFIENNPDDAQLMSDELKRMHSKASIQLEWVDSLEKGLARLAAADDIQAVLIDLFLPDSYGLDTLQPVLVCASQVPVLVMTSLADEEVGVKAVQAGAQDHLIKGEVDGRLLVRAIQYAIQRKQTELQLADAHEFTEHIFTSSPVGIFTYQLNGQCLSANAAAAKMVGGTVEQLKSQNFHELTSWRQSGLYEMARETITTGKPTSGDVHVLSSFGKEAWYTAQFALFRTGGQDLLLMMFSDISEHKQVELDLRASEEKIQNIIEHSSSVFYTHTSDNFLTYVSPQVRTVLDCKPDEAMVRWHEFLTDNPSNQQGIEATERAVQTGQRQPPYELELRTLKGRKIWVLVDESPIVRNGKTMSIVGSLTDITERKYAEAALEAGEKRFRAWIENSSDLITVVDLYGITQYQSPSVQNLLGYTPEEVLGKSAFDLLHPDDVAKLTAHFGKALQNPGDGESAECRIRHKNGSWRYMEARGQIYTDEHGEVVVLVSSRDVTDRRHAEELLREKERLLSEAQRIGHIGSWSYDIARDTITFSDEMYRLLDILPEDFHHDSKDFLALVYPSDRPTATKWMADIKEGTQEKDLNFRIFHKNGELCYLHCTGVVEFDPVSAKPVRFIGTAQDVSERQAAEMQIDQQIRRLTALSEIDRAIISSFDQRYTLGVILSQMVSQLHVDAAAVLIMDPDEEMLDYVAGQGFRTNTREATHLRLGESHAGRAAKERRMIRIPDLRQATNDLAFSQFVIGEGFVSYIAVPLLVKGKVKGVLEVFQRTLLQPYQDWLDFFNTLAGQTAIAVESTSLFANLQASNHELSQAYEATIEGWSRAMDLRDRETEGHTQRVTKLTLELARSMSIDEARLVHIRRGALLHDIGKLGVPDHILFKTGSLTIEERQIMEQHVEFAYEMLAPIPYLKPALNIPYFHHEKWDGTGYPLGLKGDQIPLEARIFSLVDVWDALLSDRPYRQAWTREQTIEYIHAQSGAHFDPQVVECFMEMINRSES